MHHVLVFDILVSDFKLWSNYQVHIQTDTVKKVMKPLIPFPAMDEILPVLVFYNADFGIK